MLRRRHRRRHHRHDPARTEKPVRRSVMSDRIEKELAATAAPHVAKSRRVSSDQIDKEIAATAATLPIVSRMTDLFTDKRMFDSFRHFEEAGFKLVAHAEHKIMSGSHKLAPGYLFKKYNNDKPGKKQLVNYMRRVEGARMLRAFIEDKGFSQVIAPRKWIYQLPDNFPERYLVVAEKLDLVSKDSTLRAYNRIGKEQTRELAIILYYFRGLNSTAENLPFTEDDKIAFIDTERWHRDKDYLRKVGERLPTDRRALAEEVYEDLRRSRARPFESKWGRD